MSAPARSGNGPKKPLYLATSQPLQVLLGGEALLLKNATGSQRFPLARLARIVCNQHADWSGAALSACLAHGITVTWVDGHGHGLGAALSAIATHAPMAAALQLYLELPDWRSRYANWLRRRRMAVLCCAARKARQAGQAYDAEAFCSLKRAYVYLDQIEPRFPAVGQGNCRALAAQTLNNASLQARYWGYDGEPLPLLDDLARLLWAALNLQCGNLATLATARSQMLFFEAWIGRNYDQLENHLAQLARHVAQENEAWP